MTTNTFGAGLASVCVGRLPLSPRMGYWSCANTAAILFRKWAWKCSTSAKSLPVPGAVMEFESRLAGFRSRPFALKQLLWPNVRFFNKQVEVIESVRDNVETYVPAGNMLGKDFVTGFIVLWTFLSWRNVKIVTTSATDLQLDVLWGEIDWFIRQSVYPLLHPRGPLVYN